MLIEVEKYIILDLSQRTQYNIKYNYMLFPSLKDTMLCDCNSIVNRAEDSLLDVWI